MDAKPDSDLHRHLGECVRRELHPLVDDLRQFVDRRIAELSAEVHGAVQLVDYSEANLAGQISRMQDELSQLIALPTAATRNSGLELESVVQATESAANRILEAAEAIGDWLNGGRDPSKLEAVAERLNSIFEACSFQDLTGQRLRRAIQHLQQVESMLSGLGQPGEQAAPPAPAEVPDWKIEGSSPDLAQDEIDRLMR